jgi:DNA-binding response OmpR family regulator
MSSVLIVGTDDDFCGVIAEHAERELGLTMLRAPTLEKAKNAEVERVIEQSAWENQKPLRLQEVLSYLAQKRVIEDISIGAARFSPQLKSLTQGEKNILLTDKESQLLLALIKNKSGVEKEMLLKDVWGVTSELESHTLETHVYRLRAKLKEVGVAATIAAAPGKYVLEL